MLRMGAPSEAGKGFSMSKLECQRSKIEQSMKAKGHRIGEVIKHLVKGYPRTSGYNDQEYDILEIRASISLTVQVSYPRYPAPSPTTNSATTNQDRVRPVSTGFIEVL